MKIYWLAHRKQHKEKMYCVEHFNQRCAFSCKNWARFFTHSSMEMYVTDRLLWMVMWLLGCS